MSDDIKEVFDLIGGVNDLLESTPEGAAIFRDLRAGEITTDEAVAQLAKVAREGGMLDTLKEASEQVNALIPGGPLSPELIEAAGRPVQMKTSTGIDQLNPLMEASIAERIAIDGDAPELRTGPLPWGDRGSHHPRRSPRCPGDTRAPHRALESSGGHWHHL